MSDIVATYRVQLNRDFTFYDLAGIVPYLRDLGISHVYCSPFFESVAGSVHGYDVIDPEKISVERGGIDGLMHLDSVLSAFNPPIKMIVDIVPNHMSANPDNPYWYDVLEKGAGSPYWYFFDMRVEAGHKIKLPFLRKEMIRIIRCGEAAIEERDGKTLFRLQDSFYPLKKSSLVGIGDTRSLTPEETIAVLQKQNYEFIGWFRAFEGASYRRFFDVSDLVGVRVEDRRVFLHTHRLLLELKKSLRSIDGVRVDHIDGLADPSRYLQELHGEFDQIWVEKILARAEIIPQGWTVCGTTGYEFIDRMNLIFVDVAGFHEIESFWRGKIENMWDGFDSCLLASREKILTDLFLPEFQRIAALLATDDRTWYFWKALTLMLPVYRTYVLQESVSIGDIGWIESALKRAGLFPGWEKRVAMIFLRPRTAEQVRGMQEWQQFTGPLMAKGMEDTAHYRYVPLAALNEVGCVPDLSESGPAQFIDWMNQRSRNYPWTLNATSTHDTKRSEDARHRLYAASAIPGQWISFVEKAREINTAIRPTGFPARIEYLFYQSLISTWPLAGGGDDVYKDRIFSYMLKASREMKMETSWLRPDEKFERQLQAFTIRCFRYRIFQEHVARFAALVSPMGAILSLSVLCLKVLGGGVPDFYQGTELWNFHLVDPDNRRPVDYDLRRTVFDSVLAEEQEGGDDFLSGLCANWRNGAIKLWLTRELLAIRKEAMAMDAKILSLLPVSGPHACRIMSFCRTTADGRAGWVITLPIRLDDFLPCSSLAFPQDYWRGTEVSFPDAMAFYDCLGKKTLTAGSAFPAEVLFRHFPVSIIRFSR